MVKRRSPVRHRVRSHEREGKHVNSYQRGKGQRTQRSRKVVAKNTPVTRRIYGDWQKGLPELLREYGFKIDTVSRISIRGKDKEGHDIWIKSDTEIDGTPILDIRVGRPVGGGLRGGIALDATPTGKLKSFMTGEELEGWTPRQALDRIMKEVKKREQEERKGMESLLKKLKKNRRLTDKGLNKSEEKALPILIREYENKLEPSWKNGVSEWRLKKGVRVKMRYVQ